MSDAVDVVIAWVDGNDPKLRNKRLKFIEAGSHRGAEATRFENLEEIYFCLRSIRKNAEWVNRIFIVTDRQIPEALTILRGEDPCFAKKIRIVDHREIFEGFSEFLPTFNSISIGSMLWRIPDLSERFIYFNDDVILCLKTELTDFFDLLKPVYRGKWIGSWYEAVWFCKNLLWKMARRPANDRRASFKDAQFLASKKVVGRCGFFSMGHTPHPALVSTFRMMFAENEALWRRNLVDRFRSFDQFSAFAAARSYDLRHGRGIARKDLSLVFLRGEADAEYRVLEKCKMMEDGRYLFGCLNGLDQLPEDLRERVLTSLRRIVS
jgi:hypothetical protein